MGVTVRQKVKGKGKPWWVFVAHNGKRTSRMVGDKSAAKEVASKIEAKLQLGEFGFEEERRVQTFKVYADSWINTTIPATCKESTETDYRSILNKHVLPVFCDQRVDAITEGQIKDFLFDKVNEGYAASTVSHFKDVISGILAKVVDDKVMVVNPAVNLGNKFMKKINDSIQARKATNGDNEEGNLDPLSKDELRELWDTVQEHFTEHYPLFLLLARTGMRIGEAVALQWGDIDFNGRFINLKRSLSRGKISTLKGKRDRRVDMSKQLAEILKTHRVKSKKKGMILGLGELPEYVFTNKNGRILDKDNWRRRIFRKAMEKAGIRTIRIHDLRHTYATLRISKGDNIADVSSQLGHFSVKFTMDVYYHWIPGKKKSEVDALDDQEFQEQVKVNEI